MNGGYKGAMEASAEGAKAAGGQTIGVTTDEFPDSVKNPFIDEEKRIPHWHGRLQYLIQQADGYVVLDGGTGTLVECVTLLEMTQKGFLKKPTVILGAKMRELLDFLKNFPEIKVAHPVMTADTPEKAIQCLKQNLF